MATKNKDIPQNLPISAEIGPKIGSGKDNMVYRLLDKPEVGNPASNPVGYVIKVNHKYNRADEEMLARREGGVLGYAERGIRYKKNKYDILKYFLGDVIPQTSFILTNEGPEGKKRYVELMVQKELPQYSLADLNDEQRNDPRLIKNMTNLVNRLQFMYSVIGEVNARVGQSSQLDAKLDLGGVSSAIRSESIDHVFGNKEVMNLMNTNSSPNILVDPTSMNIYCIDYDQGQWRPGMDDAKEQVFALANQRITLPKHLGETALVA